MRARYQSFLRICIAAAAACFLTACSLPVGGEKGDESSTILNPGYIPYETVEIEEAELTDRYYYSLLEEDSQRIYLEILQGIRDHEETITTHGEEPDLVNQIFTSVYLDWPEYFWIDGTVSTTCYSGFVSYSEVCPNYQYSKEESDKRSEQIETEAEIFLLGLDRNWSAYDQIRYVYDRMIDETYYVPGAEDNQNICSVLLNHQSVCAGYARTFQFLMNRLGIYCIYVTGQIRNGEYHAWNIVRCGEDYYNVDVTWGDPVFAQSEDGGSQLPDTLIYYDFLCCSDAELQSTHQINQDYPYPACTAEDLNYYWRQGRYYGTADQELLLMRLEQDIDNGLTISELKFTSEAIYEQTEGFLEPMLKDAAMYLCDAYGLSRVTYYYSLDPLTRKIILFWNYSEA